MRIKRRHWSGPALSSNVQEAYGKMMEEHVYSSTRVLEYGMAIHVYSEYTCAYLGTVLSKWKVVGVVAAAACWRA